MALFPLPSKLCVHRQPLEEENQGAREQAMGNACFFLMSDGTLTRDSISHLFEFHIMVCDANYPPGV